MYTCDLDLNNLASKIKRCEYDKHTLRRLNKIEKKKLKIFRSIKKKELRMKILNSETYISKLFSEDKELIAMRETFTPVFFFLIQDFYSLFSKGLQHYLDGSWQNAKTILEKTLIYYTGFTDGPSLTLLEVMKEHNFVAPTGSNPWKGYRELTEK